MRTPIYLRRGNKVDLPVLNAGEPGFATDTKQLFIGASGGNAQVAMAAQPAWISPTLLNAWVNSGAGAYNAAYMKDTIGFVHLRGIVKSGAMASAVFSLPVGYRPLADLFINGLSSNGTSNVQTRIIIRAAGNVEVYDGSNVFMALDGISFFADA